MRSPERKLGVQLLVVAALATALSGCTAVQKGAALGGAAGAGIGTAYGAIFPGVNLGEGAIIGATGGTVVGALVGADLEIQDAKGLKREVENLKSMVVAKDDAVSDLRKQLAELQERPTGADDERYEELQREIDALKEQPDVGAVCDELRKEIQKLRDEVDGLKGQSGAPEKKRMQKLSKVEDEFRQTKEISALGLDGFQETDEGLELTILGETLFRPGFSKLSQAGRRVLDSVAYQLKQRFPNNDITIEGHTDDQPIRKSGWRSNWELGAARAHEVLHYLIEMHDMAPDRLSASTFGQFRPVAQNETEEGRRQNRRAVIVIRSRPADALGRATQ